MFNLCEYDLLKWGPMLNELSILVATLYELRSATAAANKRELLVETAKWSGDGFRAAALKLS